MGIEIEYPPGYAIVRGILYFVTPAQKWTIYIYRYIYVYIYISLICLVHFVLFAAVHGCFKYLGQLCILALLADFEDD